MYKDRDTFYVYTIKNTVTKRIYVGYTMNVKERTRQHLHSLEIGKHCKKEMQSDYNKYGKDSFEIKVFTSCDNMQKASMIETIVMKILKSQDPQYGYNIGDPKGNSPLAIADRWRTIPWNWSDSRRFYYFTKHGVLLPPKYT